jgi:Flp pilus assembly protein TadG
MSPAVELVIFVPVLILIAGLIIAGGRIWFARSTVTQAAYSGARAASIERVGEEAGRAGVDATEAELSTQGLDCLTTRIDLDLSGFDVPVGQAAAVTNTVSCRISLGDTALPGLPGSLSLTARGTAAIDTYRER